MDSKPHVAWETDYGYSVFDYLQPWSVDQLNDQYQKAIKLTKEAVEEDESDHETGGEGEGNNDHNRDAQLDDENDEEENKPKTSNPYKNKYTARIMLIEMQVGVMQKKELFEQQNNAVSFTIDKFFSY